MDKLKFSAIKKEFSGRVSVLEKKTDKYVKFGEYNSFPNELIHLYNNSSIHNTCINATVEAIKGEGLVSEPDFVIDVANSDIIRYFVWLNALFLCFVPNKSDV